MAFGGPGAGRGIRLASAKAFAEAGASVVLADREEETLRKAVEGLRSASHNAIGVTCDVSDEVQVAAMIRQTVGVYGRLDAAFNNTGSNSAGAPLLDTSDDKFDRIINVNPRGIWNCLKAELRQMTAQGSGAIVNCRPIPRPSIESRLKSRGELHSTQGSSQAHANRGRLPLPL
jgi:NAD(P)-dependent dehydrogenase (short-subunit alcohol dehydrogenase family)